MTRTNGSIATNDADKAQILVNNFKTVFTRRSSLPEVVPQSRADVAKIGYVQITCGDVERILKSLKKRHLPGSGGHSTNPCERPGRRDQLLLTKIFQASLESGSPEVTAAFPGGL